MEIKVLELFGGIGACSKALERLGIDYEIADYVEIDKYAVKSFNAIHNTNFKPQDICNWDKNIEVDLIMHGSPCQDFSLAGKQAGGDEGSGTRSSLMYETIRIVEKLKPKYVIWENVKNIISKKHKHNFDNYLNKMEELGYKNYWQVLNAKDYGIPQNRERVFTISILGKDNYNFPKGNIQECETINPLKNISGKSWQFEQNVYSENSILRSLKAGGGSGNIPKIIENFEFPPKQVLKLKLKDILEDEVDEKYYIDDGILNNIVSDNQAGYLSGGKWNKINESCRRYYKEEGLAPTIHTCQGGNTEPKVLIKNATKKGYTEAYDGDSVNLLYPNSKTRRGRVGNQVSQTLQCNDSMGVVVKNINKNAKHQQDLVQHEDGICRTIPAGTHGSTPHLLKTIVNEKDEKIRIRKLTPKECWRLMGFDDSDFEKASQVCSNTQLYKQAGNSIVVNVLEAIFKNLFID